MRLSNYLKKKIILREIKKNDMRLIYCVFWYIFSGASTVAIDNKIEQAMVSVVLYIPSEKRIHLALFDDVSPERYIS